MCVSVRVCVCVCVCVFVFVFVCVIVVVFVGGRGTVGTHSRGVSPTVLSSIESANLFSNIRNPSSSKSSIDFCLKNHSTGSLTMYH